MLETHQKFLKQLKLSSKDKILDVSAGTGILAEKIVKKHGSFKKLVLNDPSKKMLERAKYRLRNQKYVEYRYRLTEELFTEEDRFTKVLCLNSFHYYVDQDKSLENISNVLEPGGTLYIQDWNRVGRMKVFGKIIDWLSPENINTRNIEEMKLLLKKHGFKVKTEKVWSFRWWNFFFIRAVKN